METEVCECASAYMNAKRPWRYDLGGRVADGDRSNRVDGGGGGELALSLIGRDSKVHFDDAVSGKTHTLTHISSALHTTHR